MNVLAIHCQSIFFQENQSENFNRIKIINMHSLKTPIGDNKLKLIAHVCVFAVIKPANEHRRLSLNTYLHSTATCILKKIAGLI